MKKKQLLTFPLFLLSFGFAFAQQGTIKGSVLSKSDNVPLPGTTVIVEGLDKAKNADPFGTYTFTGLPEGVYELQVSYLGYETVSRTVEVKENETTCCARSYPLVIFTYRKWLLRRTQKSRSTRSVL